MNFRPSVRQSGPLRVGHPRSVLFGQHALDMASDRINSWRSLLPSRVHVCLKNLRLQFEHSPAGPVQNTMCRIKIMLVSLLPVLGLVAASCASADVSGGGTSYGYRTSISAAAGHGNHGSAPDFSLSKQALRNPGRRAGMSSHPDGKSLLAAVSASGLARLQPASVSFRVVAAPPELVRGWQFLCRTASDPRAPSTVS
jgi:hypothetical protein